MNKLDSARQEINRIDREMAKLFAARMTAVGQVAQYKQENGLPIFDPLREEQVIQSNSNLIEDEVMRGYYIPFLRKTMNVSKEYQRRLLKGMKIGYSGVEGAFANIAAKRIFPGCEEIAYMDFAACYKATEKGHCDCCVLPIENSFAGEVGQVIDLIYDGSLFINGIYSLGVTHNLLGLEDAHIEDIREVVSHPQALSQCAPYISSHGFECMNATNTAVAAKQVKERNDKSVAAIASAETAALYGLKVLDHDINESTSNTTKFAVLSKTMSIPNGKNNKFILLFTVKEEPGALAKALSVIGKYNFNMNTLCSRPMKEPAWQYYFYIEAEGNENSEQGKQMMYELGEHCQKLKIAGHYSETINLGR